jgi:hypothetical protein
MRAILAHKPLATLKLDEITSEHAASFAASREAEGLKVEGEFR